MEPKIMLDGEHGIDRTFEVAQAVWAKVFFYLALNNVLYEENHYGKTFLQQFHKETVLRGEKLLECSRTSVGGSLWAKSYNEAYELIELMEANEYQNPTQRMSQGRVGGIMEADTATAIAAQLQDLMMKVDSLANCGVNQITSVCELCAGHMTLSSVLFLVNRLSLSGKVVNPEKAKVLESKVVAKEEEPKEAEVEPRKTAIVKTPPEGNRVENRGMSVVLQQKLPPKLKDPRSFIIPCTIGKMSFDKCLRDLGASINLLPLSIFKNLGLPDPKPTYMSLQLADRSITYLQGICQGGQTHLCR
ncbi:hypothetical protein AgCh_038540 [Apium graveolens]